MTASKTIARPRILLYSHDTVGLGHLRRSQAIACGLAQAFENISILMVSGARQSTMFDTPPCVDFVTIPALRKSANGSYLAKGTGLSTTATVNLRSNILRSVVQGFRPDVLIVDKVPCGVHGELQSSLEWIRSEGRTRCVLGLRDILDDAETVRREWGRDDNAHAIQHYYDAVWVYGDKKICDLEQEYRLPLRQLADVRYTGYLDRSTIGGGCQSTELIDKNTCELGLRKFVLCTVGGGEDGARLATTFARTDLPADTAAVIMTGPFMAAELRDRLHRYATHNHRLQIVDFHRRPEELLARADRVIAMGGYNTVCEILARRKTALIVPRVTPRTEQLIRAQRMSDLGLLEMLHPNQLDSTALASWVQRSVTPPPAVRQRIDFEGLSRIPRLVANLLGDAMMSDGLRRDRCPAALAADEVAR